MRLPKTAHTSLPWRIHAIAHDFDLEDVWALPTPGGADDFPRLIEMVSAWDPGQSPSFAVRMLFEIRGRLGALLGWDGPASGLGTRVASLRERLPAELRGASSGRVPSELPFTELYRTDDEWALETANATVHGILHFGWVRDEAGVHRGQMAILVKRNGLLGAAYMAAIAPFRHVIVYPASMRQFGQAWQART